MKIKDFIEGHIDSLVIKSGSLRSFQKKKLQAHGEAYLETIQCKGIEFTLALLRLRIVFWSSLVKL